MEEVVLVWDRASIRTVGGKGFIQILYCLGGMMIAPIVHSEIIMAI